MIPNFQWQLTHGQYALMNFVMLLSTRGLNMIDVETLTEAFGTMEEVLIIVVGQYWAFSSHGLRT